MEKEDLTFDPTLRRERMLARIKELHDLNKEDARKNREDDERLKELKEKRKALVEKKWQKGRKIIEKKNREKEHEKLPELFGEAKERVNKKLNGLILETLKNNLVDGESKGQLVFGQEILKLAAELGFTQEQLHNIAETTAKIESVPFTKPTVTLDGKLVSPETIEEETAATPKKKETPKQLLQSKVDSFVEQAGDKLAEVRASLEKTFNQEKKIKTREENLAASRKEAGIENTPRTTEELQKELDAMIIKLHLFQNTDRDAIAIAQNKDEHQLRINTLNDEIVALAEKLGISTIEYYAQDLIEKYESARAVPLAIEELEQEEVAEVSQTKKSRKKEKVSKTRGFVGRMQKMGEVQRGKPVNNAELQQLMREALELETRSTEGNVIIPDQAAREKAQFAINQKKAELDTKIASLGESLGLSDSKLKEIAANVATVHRIELSKQEIPREKTKEDFFKEDNDAFYESILQLLRVQNLKLGKPRESDTFVFDTTEKVSALAKKLGINNIDAFAREIAEQNGLELLSPIVPQAEVEKEIPRRTPIPEGYTEEVNTNWEEIAKNIHSHLSEETKNYIKKERLAGEIAPIQEEAEKDSAELEEKIIQALQLNEMSPKKILFEQNRAFRGETIGQLYADIERLAEKLGIKNTDEFIKNIAHSIGIEIPEPQQEVMPTEKMIYDLRKKVLGAVNKRIELGNELKKKGADKAEIQKQINELKETIEDDKTLLDRYVTTKERVDQEEKTEKRERRRVSLTPQQKKLTGTALEEMKDLSLSMFEKDFADAFGFVGIKRRATFTPEYKAVQNVPVLTILGANDMLAPGAKDFVEKMKTLAEKFEVTPKTNETLHDFVTRLYSIPATEEIVLRKYEKNAA